MPHLFTADDWISLRQISDANVSPGGEFVAFVMADSFKDGGTKSAKAPRSSIYTVPSGGGQITQITFGPRSDTTPRWSPDGNKLAFLSDRDEAGQRQVYLLDRSGGEARCLTTIKGAIPSPRTLSPLEWTADGKALAFLKQEVDSYDNTDNHDAIEFEQFPKYVRLWFAEINSGNTYCVSPDKLQIWEFSISSERNKVAAVASNMPFEQDWYVNRLVTFEPSGPSSNVYQTHRQLAKPMWSPNGSTIACLTSNWSDRGVDSGDIAVVRVGGNRKDDAPIKKPLILTKGHDASYERFEWTDDGKSLIAIANKQGGSGIAKIDLSSGQRQWLWAKKCFLSSFSRDQSGRFAALIETPDHPPNIHIGENNGKPNSKHSISWNSITNLNSKRAAEFKIGKTEEVNWVSQDGLNLQGLLITPPNAPDGPLPTVMLVHGGPTNCDRFRYQPLWRWAQLIACRGFAVFQPNYRGSTGWGLDFAEANIGDMGGADFQDMLAGLDHLISKGRIDHDRLGIAGSSYGGFTTMWAVTQTDRFRAAVSIAGISDWRSFHGRSYLHTWDRIHYGDSDPYAPDSKHARFSPIAHIKNVRTPSLILHGELDWDVPVEQSYQFYRGLKDLGVQAELVVYPREPHGLTEKAHLLDAARRIPDWFEYWMTN